MRILHCIPNMNGGGAERQLAYLAAGLGQMGWEVHVALLSGGPNLERLQASGAIIHQMSCTNNYDPSIIWQLRHILHTIRPVLMQTWLLPMDIFGGAIAWMSGVPWILSDQASELAYPYTVKNRTRSLVARKASAIISNSACGRMYWQKQMADKVPQYVISNPVP